MLVASHNLMHGARIAELLDFYRRLQRRRRIDLLCLQENVANGSGDLAQEVAAALGSAYATIGDSAAGGVAIVYDSDALSCRGHDYIRLPRLERLSALERLYIAGGKARQKRALVASMSGRLELTCVSFHLDTAGGNRHRRAQIAAIARALWETGVTGAVAVCGDTNAFAWPARSQPRVLQRLLEPLGALGAVDPGGPPTHFFARQHEPLLTHRLATLLGRAGLDLPLRYDVVCTDLPVIARGREHAPCSDHDLVWAQLGQPGI